MPSYLKELTEIWERDIKDIVCDRLPSVSRDLWFSSLKFLKFHDGVITVGLDSKMKRDAVRDRFGKTMEREFSKFLGFDVTFAFIFRPPTRSELLKEFLDRNSVPDGTYDMRRGDGKTPGETGDDDDYYGDGDGDEYSDDDSYYDGDGEGDGYRDDAGATRDGVFGAGYGSRENGAGDRNRVQPPAAFVNDANKTGIPRGAEGNETFSASRENRQGPSPSDSTSAADAVAETRYGSVLRQYYSDMRATEQEREEQKNASSRTQPGEQAAQAPDGAGDTVPEKHGIGSWGSTLPPYNFEYTFDNFIVGNSNKFAHAACTAVAANPAMNYNPLFIYGPSGLGKTHLLYAITNEVKRKKGNIKIIYIKGEDFTNQFIEALAASMTVEFRNKYRSCDMLLIDDIQFIAGKPSTQEEFFHTFNALYEDHKQIILTSDRPPRDMKTLEDRLKTRFEWGLLADIQPPDLELRVAIIKKKAEQVGVTIPDEVLTYLAENLRSNIRQIEGAMKKLGATVFLSGQEITMDLARGCINDLLGGEEPVSVTVDKIFATIYKKYGIKKEDLISQRRSREIAQARHITIYLIRRITEMSLPNIGKIFNRDHTTVLASNDSVEKKLLTDTMLNLDVNEMIKEVTGEVAAD